MPELIEQLRNAFRGRTTAPDRQIYSINAAASLLVMPAWADEGELGVKLVHVDTSRERAVEALYIMHRNDTPGKFMALDGAMLTARRTAALSALAADILSSPTSSRLLLVGTGTLIPHLLEAYSAIRKLDRVAIWGRDLAKAEALIAKIDADHLDVVVARDLDTEVAAADIICCATSSTTAIVKGKFLSSGTHVNLLGAFRPNMSEADPETFARADVFADSCAGVMAEAGDLLDAVAQGDFDPANIKGELSDICHADFDLRNRSEKDITLFKSVGLSVADFAAAQMVMAANNDIAAQVST